MNISKRKYEREKRGKCVLKIMLCQSDDPEEWKLIRKGMIDRYGTLKNAVYQMSKREGFLSDIPTLKKYSHREKKD